MTPRAVQTGSVTSGIKNGIRTRLWRNGQLEVEDFPIEEISDHLQEEGALVWLDLCDPDHDLLLKLADELTLDPHAVEDCHCQRRATEGHAPCHAHLRDGVRDAPGCRR